MAPPIQSAKKCCFVIKQDTIINIGNKSAILPKTGLIKKKTSMAIDTCIDGYAFPILS